MKFTKTTADMLQRLQTLVDADQYNLIQSWAGNIACFENKHLVEPAHVSEAMVWLLTPERLSEVDVLERPSARVECARALGFELPDDPEPWRVKLLALMQAIPETEKERVATILTRSRQPTVLQESPFPVYTTVQLKSIYQELCHFQMELFNQD